MTEATLAAALSEEHASLSLDGVAHEVTLVRGHEAVSTLFRFDIVCHPAGDHASPASMIGREAHLVLRDGYGAERPVRAVVTEASVTVTDEAQASLSLVLRPACYKLTVGRGCRVFHDASVPDIVHAVLAAAGLETRFELVERYAKRPYTAQYRESDWDFVCRLCEEEGIHYWFDHEEAESLLVFADRSSAAPDLAGGATLAFATMSGLEASGEHVHELGPVFAFQPQRFTLRSFDPSRPKLDLTVSRGEGLFEVYEAPGAGPGAPDIVARRVQVRQERAEAQRATVTGKSSSLRLVPGRIVAIVGHPAARLDGRYFVTRATLVVAQRRRGEAQGPQPPTTGFDGVAEATPFRPAALTPPARHAGLQTGVVVGPPGEEIHPDEAGRIRVQAHWDREGTRDDRSGHFLRVAQRGTAGSMLLPRVGWHVFTLGEEGSVDAPILFNRFYDAEHVPPYGLPEAMTRTVYKTATTPGGGSFNEIRFEDMAGAQEMFLDASRDMQMLVQDDKSETVMHDAAKVVGHDSHLDVGQNVKELVSGSQSVTIGANESEDVGAGREKTVGGDETVRIGGSRKLETGAASTLEVTGGRKLSVGVGQIDVCLGDISATAPFVNVLVGGVMVKMTLSKMSESVGQTFGASTVTGLLGSAASKLTSLPGVSGILSGLPSASFGGVAQTVGGAKLELTPSERQVKVGKQYVESVGGAMVLQTATTFLDEAEVTLSYSVVGPLSAKAPDVVIEGEAEVTLVCGGASIKVTPDGVAISAPTLDLSNASLMEATGKSIIAN